MELEAVYEGGKLEFSRPVKFKRNRVHMMVNVPDEAIEDAGSPYDLPEEVVEEADRTRSRLDAIRNAPLPPDDELPPVSDKSMERMREFALREDR